MRRPLFRTLTSTGWEGLKLTLLGHWASHRHSSLLQSSMLLQRVWGNWTQLKINRGILIAKIIIWKLLHSIPPMVKWHEKEKYCFHLPLLPLCHICINRAVQCVPSSAALVQVQYRLNDVYCIAGLFQIKINRVGACCSRAEWQVRMWQWSQWSRTISLTNIIILITQTRLSSMGE